MPFDMDKLDAEIAEAETHLAALRDKRQEKLQYKQQTWQERQRRNGRCTICGKPRGIDGTASLCRVHADKQKQTARRRRANKK